MDGALWACSSRLDNHEVSVRLDTRAVAAQQFGSIQIFSFLFPDCLDFFFTIDNILIQYGVYSEL